MNAEARTRHVIARLLTNLGSRKEVEQYLKTYAGAEAQKFAVIKVGGRILDEQLDALTSSLSFLYEVGLYPVVVHGAGAQLNRALEEAGIASERIDGLRVTTPEVLDVARRVFQLENNRIVMALERMGTRARPLTSGVFQARTSPDRRLGLVGEVQGVALAPLKWCIEAGQLPIIAPLGESAQGQILNLNADVAARELAWALEPHKIVFLTDTGGLLDDKKRILGAVNFAEDYDELMAQEWVKAGMRLKLQQIKELLDKLPLMSSVSITSPQHLARELFTHTGAGTLLRIGERVRRFDGLSGVAGARMHKLLEACFDAELAPDYFETRRCCRVYLADSYHGSAIVTRRGGIPYLDKFAVTDEAQGRGVGGSIWQRMRRDNTKLFWRARAGNPTNAWYFARADGMYRSAEWVIFWYGLEGFDEMKRCAQQALAVPPTIRRGSRGGRA